MDFLDLAVRAYTVRGDQGGAKDRAPGRSRVQRSRRVPEHLLIIDTETTADRTQRLLFGCWRFVRLSGDGPKLELRTVEEGLFYPDDLGSWDPVGLETLQAHVRPWRAADVDRGDIDAVAQLRAIPLSEFLAGWLWRAGYELRAGVVCFNWPFDISRLAWRAGRAINRDPDRDDPIEAGFSFALWKRQGEDEPRRSRYRPDIGIKAIDSKRALKIFRSPEKVDPENLVESPDQGGKQSLFRGNFLDLRTLAFSLTDRSHSLESACEAFGVPYEKRKVEHGQIKPEYIEYCREDVAATTQLAQATLREFHRHPVDLQASRAYSPATIGKAYLRKMGVKPPSQQEIDPKILGWSMSAYYGGRAECRIRRTPVPVVYCDFLSMYPSVCALMGAWDLLRSDKIRVDENAQHKVEDLLEAANLECWFDPESWRQLLGIAQVLPKGDILPVRARYGAGPSWQIGINPLTSSEPMWFPIADLVASKLLTGRTPEVLKAIRLHHGEPEANLRPSQLLGAVDIDPQCDDFFRAVVEERKAAERGGLDSRAKGLKVLASATSYGIYAQMTRRERSAGRKVPVIVYSDADEPWQWETQAPEEPGDFCFPPLAASITGAARLMLALLERQIGDLGGSYAFCDTDSMAIVASSNGGELSDLSVKALSYAKVDEIRERFETLNPYAAEAIHGPLLELEDENFTDKSRQKRSQLWCYSISAKRYVLYNKRRSGAKPRAYTAPDATAAAEDAEQAAERKASQHGLGHLMNPIDPERDDRDWIAEAWRYMLAKDLGEEPIKPAWLDKPALARSTVSTPGLAKLFRNVNTNRPYAQQIKPFNFMLIAFVSPIERPADEERIVLVAPYEQDSGRWLELPWFNRHSGREYRITTEPSGGRVIPGFVCVKTYRDFLEDYLAHAETKSAATTGGACRPRTKGLLLRRPVQMQTTAHIGKEANRLEDVEAGLIADLGEIQSDYDDYYSRVFSPLVLPVLRSLGVRETARRMGSSPAAVSAVLAGHSRPRRRAASQYETVALATAARGSRAATADPLLAQHRHALLKRYVDSL